MDPDQSFEEKDNFLAQEGGHYNGAGSLDGLVQLAQDVLGKSR
jgi:hypothetical protein